MYFGKPIPEWITEHKNDTITLGEIVAACDQEKRVAEDLARNAITSGYNLETYSYFVREARESNRALHTALDILGTRYGYPNDAPKEDGE